MTGHLGALVLFDENLYKTGHMANRWMHTLVLHFEEHAKATAPKRSGELAGLITSEAHREGPKVLGGSISSNADHTWYVLEGTTGPIMSRAAWAAGGDTLEAFTIDAKGNWVPREGYWLPVGNRPWPPITYRHSVRGQSANNFLFKAWRRTARNHTSIRGFVPDVISF